MALSGDQLRKLDGVLARVMRGGTKDETLSACGIAYDLTEKAGETIGDHMAARSEVNRVIAEGAVLQQSLAQITEVVDQLDKQLKEKDEKIQKQAQTIRSLEVKANTKQPKAPRNPDDIHPALLWCAAAEAVLVPTAFAWANIGGTLGTLIGVQAVAGVLTAFISDGLNWNDKDWCKFMAKTTAAVVGVAAFVFASDVSSELTGRANLSASKEYAEHFLARKHTDNMAEWKKGMSFGGCLQRDATDDRGYIIEKDGKALQEDNPDKCYLVKVVDIVNETTEAGVIGQTVQTEILGSRSSSVTGEKKASRGGMKLTRFAADGKTILIPYYN